MYLSASCILFKRLKSGSVFQSSLYSEKLFTVVTLAKIFCSVICLQFGAIGDNIDQKNTEPSKCMGEMEADRRGVKCRGTWKGGFIFRGDMCIPVASRFMWMRDESIQGIVK